MAKFDLSAVKSIEKAITLSTPAVGEIIRQTGGKVAMRAFIEAHIVSLRDFVNIGAAGSMTNEQTRATAEMVVEDFPSLTLADVALIFRRAKRGDYGKLYGRLDGQIILSWITDYIEERSYAHERISISEAGVLRSGYSDELGIKAVRKFAEELSTLNRKKLSSPCPASTDGGKN